MPCWNYKSKFSPADSGIFFMSRFHSYITSAKTVIESYKGGVPLQHHLKLFFQTDKKFGSRDRKSISAICYHFFRCAFLLGDIDSFEEKIVKSTFLCENTESELLKSIAPEYNELITFDAEDKLDYLGISSENLFRFEAEISESIDKKKYALSYFIQPDLFLRIRPQKKQAVTESLKKAGIEYRIQGEDTLILDNGIAVENCLQINKDVVIQDLNSQRILDFYKKERDDVKTEDVWDCCAASGGKSILVFDICRGKVKITASDIRENILTNLQLRFKEAGINLQKKFVQDLSVKSGLLLNEKFSLIICDVPCSGSGTWARTPEQYHSFSNDKIQSFSDLQKKIINNTLPHLSKDGWFVYITCSVFKSENEEIVDYIQSGYSCQLMEMKYLKGYNDKADTLFVAYFKN